MVYPAIMCGGSGTRLWPVSRPSRPKQFVPLIGTTTPFQNTVDRVRGIGGFRKLIVISGAQQAHWVAQQLPADVASDVLLEPEGRDSAAAIAAIAHVICETDPKGVLVILASDHHVPDKDTFQAAVSRAVAEARKGRIVTLGIQPDHPSPAYGYIKPRDASDLSHVEAFVEKPDIETASRYIESGYLWNSGNFIVAADVLLDEMRRHIPDVVEAVGHAVTGRRRDVAGHILSDGFRDVRKISIDYGVMERTQLASVLRSPFKWSDLGSWDAVHAALSQDDVGNAAVGSVALSSSHDTLVFNRSDKLCVVEGGDGLNVVLDDDCVFVSTLARSQKVKDAVESLKDLDLPQTDNAKQPFDLATASNGISRWLMTQALPLWWTHGFDHGRKLWREELTQEGEPTESAIRARVQGRQTFCYAMANQLGWSGPSGQAVDAGFDAIGSYCKMPNLLTTLVTSDGTVLDNRILLYDQTFHMLALVAASNRTDGAEQRALAVLDAIETTFERASAGYREAGDQPYQSNAHMHLFEACLEWAEHGCSPRWHETASRIATLAMERFIDPAGFIREFFDGGWIPAQGEAGHVVEPGHQFEWSWLLQRWALCEEDDAMSTVAKKLFECGVAGLDLTRGVVVDTLNDDLKQVTDQARLWPQIEWLKAALLLSETARGDRRYWLAQVAAAYTAVMRYLATPVSGLWFDKCEADGSFVNEPAPASSFYHIVTAVVQMRCTASKLPKDQ